MQRGFLAGFQAFAEVVSIAAKESLDNGNLAPAIQPGNMEMRMRSVLALLRQLKSDEDGASLIEYTVLLGILLIAVITIIGGVGNWINNEWAALNSALPTPP
jgi:pilus assembly protein Flp/PilA